MPTQVVYDHAFKVGDVVRWSGDPAPHREGNSRRFVVVRLAGIARLPHRRRWTPAYAIAPGRALPTGELLLEFIAYERELSVLN